MFSNPTKFVLWQAAVSFNHTKTKILYYFNKYYYIKVIENVTMARPKPKIILEYTDPKSYRSEQILAATAIYAVFHDGKPVNLRSLNSLVNYPGPKYKKVSFSNSGHAFNLATRLNKLFKTDKFVVVKLTSGEVITEDDDNEFL